MSFQDEIKAAADALSRGGVAAFPTDTVYGLGVAACAAESPQALFDMKRRDAGKPVAWLVGGVEDLRAFGRDVPEYAEAWASAFWPGSLTLVVRASGVVPRAFQSDAGTIGLRMPASDVALALIRAVGFPLATTSANLSGKAAPCRFEDLDPEIAAAVDAVVHDDGQGRFAKDAAEAGATSGLAFGVTLGAIPGATSEATHENGTSPHVPGMVVPAASGIASTVVDCTAKRPIMLREGSLSAADLCAVVAGLRFAD